MENYLRHEISSDRIELITRDTWKHQDPKALDQEESYDRGDATRRLCLSAIAVSAALAVVCIALGATVFKAKTPGNPGDGFTTQPRYPHNWSTVSVAPVTGELLPLALNAIMTVCLDSLGFIHATTLRWALGTQLTFNANLRLFTSSRTCIALSWPANTLYALLMILCYTSTSLLFASPPSVEFCNMHGTFDNGYFCGDDVSVSPPALYCLGIGLIGQCVLVGWQYVSVKVPTWSSNPLDTGWAMVCLPFSA